MVRHRQADRARRAGRRRAGRGRGVGAGHGASVHARRRPVRGLLRHRHARVRAADRGRAGAGLPGAGASVHPGRADQAPGRGRHRRARRPGLGHRALFRPRPGRLPGGPDPGRARRGRPGRRGGRPGGHRRDHQLGAAALGGHPVLRDLPVALAGDRAQRRAGRPGIHLTLAVAGGDGRRHRPGVGLVAVHRDARHAERPAGHRAALGPGARRGQPPPGGYARPRRSRHGGRGRGGHLRGGRLRHRPAARARRPDRAAAAGGQRRAGERGLPVDPAGQRQAGRVRAVARAVALAGPRLAVSSAAPGPPRVSGGPWYPVPR